MQDTRLDQIQALADEARTLARDLADELTPDWHEERFLAISAGLHLLQATKAVQRLQVM